MHIGSSLPAGVRYLIAFVLIVVLFLPGTSGANVTPGTTETLSITPTPSSGSLEGLPLQTATELPTASIPHDPPRIENIVAKGMEPRFWPNPRSEYDIRVEDRELRAKLSPRIRVFHPTTG